MLQDGWLTGRRTRWGICALLVAGAMHGACAEVTDPAQMLEQMRANFILDSGVAIGNRIDAQVTWRMEPGGPALRSGNVLDQWQVLSDGDRYGTERLRQSPDGDRKTRTVYMEDERREFEFDLGASGATAVAGKMIIRHQFNRGSMIRLPLLDYLDRLYSPPGRLGFEYNSLQLNPELVSIDGHPCHEVTGSWMGREFTFWLDPAFGFLPRQYTLQITQSQIPTGRRRGWRDPRESWLLAPPPELAQSSIPIRTEERLSSAELGERNGRFVIATAVLERTQFFEGGSEYAERSVLNTGDYVFAARRDVKGFLEFTGLVRDGTPVEEFFPPTNATPEYVERYTLSGGRKLPTNGTFTDYMKDLGEDLSRLGRDFSLQNLKRIDSMFLVVVCAVAALLLNGGIAYANYRKNRPKPS